MAGITAVTFTALITAGTFAWTNLNSQRVNEWQGNSSQVTAPGGTLHDDYEQSEDSKQVYVENWGDTDLFVRIRLDEYMELGQGAGIKLTDGSLNSPQNLAEPLISGTSIANLSTWKSHIPTEPDVDLCDSEFHDYWNWKMGGQKYYKPAPADKRTDKDYVDTNSSKYLTANEAIKQTLPAQVLTMSQWKVNSSPIGSLWVIDTDGWAYWAAPLKPGEATGLLLNSVEKIKEPEKDYYYGINVIAQMATKDGVDSNGDLDNYKRFGLKISSGWTDDGEVLMESIVTNTNLNLNRTFFMYKDNTYLEIFGVSYLTHLYCAGPDLIPGTDDDLKNVVVVNYVRYLTLEEDGWYIDKGPDGLLGTNDDIKLYLSLDGTPILRPYKR